MTNQEIVDLVTHAQNMTLDDEIAVMRILLRRLMKFISDDDISLSATLAIADEAVKTARAVAFLLRHMSADGSPLWDDILDQVSRDLDMQL